MFGDAHSTNWAENYQFFLNQNNPTNFERIWNQAYYLYRRIGAIQNRQVPFDQVMDFSVIQKLGKEEKYKSQKRRIRDPVGAEDRRRNPGRIGGNPHQHRRDPLLSRTIGICTRRSLERSTARTVEGLYDPNVDHVLEGIAKLAGQFGAARVVIEGHTDSSMRGQVPGDLVKELSLNRANAVKEALVQKFNLEPEPVRRRWGGLGPAGRSQHPLDQAKNRRVEIKVYPAEQQ